ncbi:aldo/keto reductase [Denitrobaculum tricleocarpae]|uniref:Aldo/keto reductase n=1 Tax=Denitrobaculum tricleocarpae TaxID=2591009 RepID=A0A545TB82_9PROT|nr:aldo/keto reductase [Denitrobaculum tricleocarpae]TQV74472.1 aldo/keto reductase [Denitrobaculum tricleocarpae]
MNERWSNRRLGAAGPELGPLGIGTWAIGGPFFSGEGCRYATGAPLGYGEVDDRESIRALHCAVDLGARLFDTADAYGTGHGERILGEAMKGKRDRVFIATKFGNTYDEATKTLTGVDVSPAYIRRACEASLKRLQTGWIDLYQLHLGDLPVDQAEAVADTLDGLCDEGLIRSYAWSTDDPARAAVFCGRASVSAVQFDLNVFSDAPGMLEACSVYDCAGLTRVPLAMGFLSGKFSSGSRLSETDIRATPPDWLPYFETGGGAKAEWEARLDAIREILASKGRTVAQGALAWIWARSARTLPIPGVRTAAQVEENLGAIDFGPLEEGQMLEIERLLGRG